MPTKSPTSKLTLAALRRQFQQCKKKWGVVEAMEMDIRTYKCVRSFFKPWTDHKDFQPVTSVEVMGSERRFATLWGVTVFVFRATPKNTIIFRGKTEVGADVQKYFETEE